MSVLVRIPTILRSYTGGAAEVTAAEGTLREVIAGLDAAYPGLGGRILDDGGKLRRFVNVYVGEAGARVSFIPAVAGGAPAMAGGAPATAGGAPATAGGAPRAAEETPGQARLREPDGVIGG